MSEVINGVPRTSRAHVNLLLSCHNKTCAQPYGEELHRALYNFTALRGSLLEIDVEIKHADLTQDESSWNFQFNPEELAILTEALVKLGDNPLLSDARHLIKRRIAALTP